MSIQTYMPLAMIIKLDFPIWTSAGWMFWRAQSKPMGQIILILGFKCRRKMKLCILFIIEKFLSWEDPVRLFLLLGDSPRSNGGVHSHQVYVWWGDRWSQCGNCIWCLTQNSERVFWDVVRPVCHFHQASACSWWMNVKFIAISNSIYFSITISIPFPFWAKDPHVL